MKIKTNPIQSHNQPTNQRWPKHLPSPDSHYSNTAAAPDSPYLSLAATDEDDDLLQPTPACLPSAPASAPPPSPLLDLDPVRRRADQPLPTPLSKPTAADYPPSSSTWLLLHDPTTTFSFVLWFSSSPFASDACIPFDCVCSLGAIEESRSHPIQGRRMPTTTRLLNLNTMHCQGDLFPPSLHCSFRFKVPCHTSSGWFPHACGLIHSDDSRRLLRFCFLPDITRVLSCSPEIAGVLFFP
ncbi:uncharacterized protein LOC123448391 [Hordeum vulgare subsp. vulgare]|uniref:uncharacterized protein LOC123448391 n=1 Tax=Hordeum vulgare subsp. vulgare TaxID=112509 RepID=UPI001D1A468E|nr:uncharacterized protein LOC123448391 [Hordeum vulgare subsp. vulgare]